MAWRLQVFGSYGASEEEFRSALRPMEEERNCEPGQGFQIYTCGKWIWSNASVWSVGGLEIDEALATLATPSIRVTASDCVLWMLALMKKGEPTFRGVHHFTQVGDEDEDYNDDELDEKEDDFDEDFPEDEITEAAGIDKFDPELNFLWDAEEAERLRQEYAEEQANDFPALEEYTYYGVQLPEPVVTLLKQQSERQGEKTALLAHGEQIVEALTEFGFSFDRERVLALLTTDNLTEKEAYSDIGNMPRFLELMGITNLFQQSEEDSTAEEDNLVEMEDEIDDDFEDDDFEDDDFEDDDLSWEDCEPGERFASIAQIISETPFKDLTDQPLRLALEQIMLLHVMAHYCSESPQVLVSLRFSNSETTPHDIWLEHCLELEARHENGIWELCIDPHLHGWWLDVESKEDLREYELYQCLKTIPEKTDIELTFVVKGLTEKCHRYAGIVQKNEFLIQKAWPEVSAARLQEALDVMNLLIGKKAIPLLSEAEEQAVRESYEFNVCENPRIRNGKVKPEEGTREYVVRPLFYERFRDLGPWDIQGSEELRRLEEERIQKFLSGDCSDVDDDTDEDFDEELNEEDVAELQGLNDMLQAMKEMTEKYRESKRVPHNDEVVFSGKTGNFYRAEMSALEHISEESLQEDDQQFVDIGMKMIADMVGDVDQQQELTRCYAGHPQAIGLLGHRTEENRFGWLHEGNMSTMLDFSRGLREFHTHFEDGSVLVTNNNYGAQSHSEFAIFVRTYEDFTVTELWKKHQAGIALVSDHRQTSPMDHSDAVDPIRFAELSDELLHKVIKSMQGE